MRSLDKAEGINIGSVLIDTEVRNIVEKRLAALHIRTELGLKWLAEKMMDDSDFALFKSDFGNSDSFMKFYMDVPGKGRQQVVLEGYVHSFWSPLMFAYRTKAGNKTYFRYFDNEPNQEHPQKD